MPIYEYQCRKCKNTTEVIQKITDKPLTKCRECGGRLEKLISSPAIQFKGTGWYVTDYARKGEKADGGDGKKAESEAPAAGATEKKEDKAKTEKSESGDKKSSGKATPSKASSNE